MSTSSRVELIRPAELSDRTPYAYAARVDDASRLVFSAGACPINQDGVTVAIGRIREQTVRAMDNLEVTLRASGVDLSDVVKTTVYVVSTRREDLHAAWEVVRGRFGDHEPPSTLLGVTVLGYRDQLVEIEVIAAQ
jgi:enamine deaminase RidA (YjgF/YER057c/UK114 family)